MTSTARGHDRPPLPARLAGAVWGHLVGDALGVPYEFRDASAIGTVQWGATGSHHQPPGTWSDDGALMLALLDSLLEAGFDPEDQGRRARAWRERGAYAAGGTVFDIGNATRAALDTLAAGVPAVDAGPSGERDCGNGSLMRILPLALVERDVPDARLVDMAHLASRVTHGHPRCQVACALYSFVARRILAGARHRADAQADARAALRATYQRQGSGGHLAALDELEAWPGRGGRGYVIDSLWSAWDAFAGATGYQDAVTRAVRYGADTDTTAAIAGGLAGAWFGVDDIPAEWRAGMRDPGIVRPLVDGLIATDPAGGWRTSAASPLRVDQVETGSTAELPGRIGITFLPGKRSAGMAGHHWRDLDADLERIRRWGDTLLLLVEDHELLEAGVPDIAAAAVRHGITLVRFPIPDPHVPRDVPAYRAVVRDMVERLHGGRSIVVACRGGIDRSGMTVACILRELGLDADTAIARTQAGRKGSITRSEQQALVRAWA
ncbi:MAG: ADP-ribosylglycohydrolase family protein [Chloroflexota bacterium]